MQHSTLSRSNTTGKSAPASTERSQLCLCLSCLELPRKPITANAGMYSKGESKWYERKPQMKVDLSSIDTAMDVHSQGQNADTTIASGQHKYRAQYVYNSSATSR